MVVLILFVVGTTLFLAREIGRRAEAEDKLEELATTDALTGLKNRRKFDSEIDHGMAAGGAQQDPGRAADDRCRSFQGLQRHLRPSGRRPGAGRHRDLHFGFGAAAGDCPARYGGEEFAVLLPGLSAVEAFTVAETIRLKVEQWSEDPGVTTVSIGVASMTPAAPSNWSDLIEAADKALYAAKANGRNQSVLAAIPQLALVA